MALVSSKRAYPRYQVKLQAVTTAPGGASLDCVVEDFCQGGMFITFSPQTDQTRQWCHGDPIEVRIPQVMTAAGQGISLQGQVARIVDIGMGISFTRMDNTTLQLMLDHARREAVAAPPNRSAQFEPHFTDLVADSREEIKAFIAKIVEAFIQQSVASLDKADELSKKNWRGIIDTQQRLRANRHKLTECYVTAIMHEFEQQGQSGAQQAVHDNADELSLIADQDFQKWLTATTLVTKLDTLNDDMLFALEQRLGAILNRPINRQDNPIGSVALVQHFQQCLEVLDLEEDTKPYIYSAFEELILSQSGPFYEQLNKHLSQQGVLPELKKDLQLLKRANAPRRPSSPQDVQESRMYGRGHPGTAPSDGGMVRPGPQEMTNTAHAPFVDGSAAIAVDSAPDNWVFGTSASGGNEMSSYAALNELLHLERAARQARQGDEGCRMSTDVPKGSPEQMLPTAVSGAQFSPQELDRGVALLHQQGITIRHLKREGTSLASYLAQVLAEQSLGDGSKQLPVETQDKLEVTESLLSSIQTDPVADDDLKDWFERVEFPFIKMALNNEHVLGERSHPVHHLLNTLDQLFRLLPSEKTELRKQLASKVEAALRNLSDESGGDRKALDDAVDSLNKLYGEQSEEYRRRVDAVIAACNLEPKTHQFSLDMVEDIDRLFDLAYDRLIPRVILGLLDAGWKNWMWRHCQNEGMAGGGYHGARATMEQLLVRLLGKAQEGLKGDWPNHKLVEEVSKVLERFRKDDMHAVELVGELIADLERPESDQVKLILVKKGLIVQRLVDSWEREQLAKRPAEVSKGEWDRWLKRAEALVDGELVSYKDAKGNLQQLKLVWSDRKWGRHVFVDREGNKALDLRTEDIASAMSLGYLFILEGWDRPLMDRASYTMLQSIHDRLIEQTNHDALTNLMNRRGFESALTDILARAKVKHSKNILCYFDLDRFNVINITCGHEAGDELLCSLAEILKREVGSEALIARVGGDEFAIVLEGCDQVQGMARAEEIRKAINDVHFRCENKEFVVDASFGVASIDAEHDSVRTLFAAVDSACFAAKDAGRGRIQFYDSNSDIMVKRHGVMDWVGRITKLFDAGLIQLKCQKIVSLKYARELPRYEVLLHVRNEKGELVSLEQFVMSAERYNRILEIDRWVVDTVFAWLRANRNRVNALGSLSINLSGHSVADEKFMNELVSRLEQGEVPARKICFEITETAAISNLEQAGYYMRRMHQTGCQLALDDFGSGHASYAYLKTMPVDFVKVDGQFVRNISTNVFDYSVVKSIQEMAHALGKRTIAEYIEDEIVLDKLRKIGVDFGQGYIFEKPIPLDELALA